MLIKLLALCRLAVGVKVTLQILPSVVSCLRLLTEPLGISKVPSVTLLTISLKVMQAMEVGDADGVGGIRGTRSGTVGDGPGAATICADRLFRAVGDVGRGTGVVQI